MDNAFDWIGLLSAIASFAMVFITWRTLKQNKEQLNELKRQWEDEHTPELLIDIVKNLDGYYIRFENVGRYIARNITFNINSDFINSITIKELKEKLLKSCSLYFNLRPNDCKEIYLCTLESSSCLSACQHPILDNHDRIKERLVTINKIEVTVTDADLNYEKVKDNPIVVKVQYANNKKVEWNLSVESYKEKVDSDIVYMLKKINETLINNGTR